MSAVGASNPPTRWGAVIVAPDPHDALSVYRRASGDPVLFDDDAGSIDLSIRVTIPLKRKSIGAGRSPSQRHHAESLGP